MNEVTISREALSAYLYDVGALEVAKQQAIERQKSSQQHLEHNDAIIKNLKEPSPPIYEKLDSTKSKVVGSLIAIIAGAMIGSIICFILSIPLKWFGIILGIKHYCIVVGIVSALILLFYLVGDNDKLIKEENNKLKAQYEKELARYKQTMNDYNTAYPYFSEELEKYKKAESEISKELQQEYSLGILHPQYQNMEAVLVMHNLLITGRCDTLKEALNTYEDFVWKRKDTQWKDAVLQQLTAIYNNQQELICSVDTLNKQTANIAALTERGFDKLQTSAEEISMQTQIIEGNTRAMAILQTYDFWQNNVLNHSK